MIIGTIALILLAAASLPALVILIYVYVKDRTEREPGRLLIKLILGVFLSTVMAIVTELIGEKILAGIEFASTDQRNFVKYMLVVALSEEFFKYIVMRKITWKNPNFNCSFDGVVYAVFTSLGFAILENVFYIINGGLTTALMRAVTAIPGHASFGVFMGAWYGFARRRDLEGDPVRSARCRRMAVLVPALLHGAYDFIAARQTETLTLVFIVFVFAMFIGALSLVKRMSKSDEYLAPRWEPF